MKDHYRTLGIHPKASAEEIKKAFRVLARQHHPDADRENPFAAARFREVQEAYVVLTNPAQRRRYDEERWLSGLFRNEHKGPVTPDTLLRDARKLAAHIRTVDTIHMNHAALRDLILFLLSDAHLSILHSNGDGERQALFSASLLETASTLRPEYFEPVSVRLALISPGNETMLHRIRAMAQTRRKQAWWDRWTPLIILAFVVALCVAMMLTAPKN